MDSIKLQKFSTKKTHKLPFLNHNSPKKPRRPRITPNSCQKTPHFRTSSIKSWSGTKN